MEENYPGGQPPLDETSFVERYGETEAVLGGGLRVPLHKALAIESALCPAEDVVRLDPERRLRYLAHMLGPDALDPEHHYLLQQEEAGGS